MQSCSWEGKQTKRTPSNHQEHKKTKPLKITKRSHCHNRLTIMLIDCKENTQTFMANRLGSQSEGP